MIVAIGAITPIVTAAAETVFSQFAVSLVRSSSRLRDMQPALA